MSNEGIQKKIDEMGYDAYYARSYEAKMKLLNSRASFEDVYYKSQYIIDMLEPLDLKQRDYDMYMMHLFDITNQEIADMFGCSRSIPNRIIVRTRKKLQDYYNKGKIFDKDISGEIDLSEHGITVTTGIVFDT